jgi:blue copper oxidase
MKKIAAIIYISLASVVILWGAGTQAETKPETGQSALPVPPLLEGENLKLVMEEGSLTLPMGTSRTMGFNGDYLGPTIRVSNGDKVNMEVQNTLKEDSTVHWHGLHVPAEFDGGPHQIVKAGSTWNPKFRIDQKAATLWYHPHLLGKTAEQVYIGMAGLFYIEDDYSKNLPIPKEYGIDDFPLVLQDRRLDKKGQFTYSPGMHDVMNGYIGNIILVNGAYEPYLDLKKGTYRFRVINGSNSSIFRVKFRDFNTNYLSG